MSLALLVSYSVTAGDLGPDSTSFLGSAFFPLGSRTMPEAGTGTVGGDIMVVCAMLPVVAPLLFSCVSLVLFASAVTIPSVQASLAVSPRS